MDKYNDEYDYAYDADNEYDVNDDEDNYPQISRQTFIDIGIYMMQRSNEPRDNMDRVLVELRALHECRMKNKQNLSIIVDDVGPCRPPLKSVSSGLFSLCSNETDETVFKYYVSDDEIMLN
jgi:hypothetical protein